MRDQWRDTYETALAAYQRHGEHYADAAGLEMDLEAERPIIKDAAIRRIMEQPNPLNQDKPHSATSAEKLVELDSGYRAHLRRQRDAVYEKNMAFTRMQAAKLTAEMAIALLRSHDAGVVA